MWLRELDISSLVSPVLVFTLYQDAASCQRRPRWPIVEGAVEHGTSMVAFHNLRIELVAQDILQVRVSVLRP